MNYKFAPDPENNAYVFVTDFGWLYTVIIKQSADYFLASNLLHNNNLVFEIIFSRSQISGKETSKRADKRIATTIQSILLHHFEAAGHLPLYFFICHAADEKEASRLKLFTKWYESIDVADWQLYTYELKDGNSVVYYGLFVNHNHPYSVAIPTEFERFAQKEKFS